MSIDQIDTAMTTTATNTLPRHVAVIMDGNGRWALAQGLDRSAGHVEGVATVHRITQAASDMGHQVPDAVHFQYRELASSARGSGHAHASDSYSY